MADKTPAPKPEPAPPAATPAVVLATQNRLAVFVVPNPDGDDLVIDHEGVSIQAAHVDGIYDQAARCGVRLVDITEQVNRVDAQRRAALASIEKD